jgi:hypothetical protein
MSFLISLNGSSRTAGRSLKAYISVAGEDIKFTKTIDFVDTILIKYYK